MTGALKATNLSKTRRRNILNHALEGKTNVATLPSFTHEWSWFGGTHAEKLINLKKLITSIISCISPYVLSANNGYQDQGKIAKQLMYSQASELYIQSELVDLLVTVMCHKAQKTGFDLAVIIQQWVLATCNQIGFIECKQGDTSITTIMADSNQALLLNGQSIPRPEDVDLIKSGSMHVLSYPDMETHWVVSDHMGVETALARYFAQSFIAHQVSGYMTQVLARMIATTLDASLKCFCVPDTTTALIPIESIVVAKYRNLVDSAGLASVTQVLISRALRLEIPLYKLHGAVLIRAFDMRKVSNDKTCKEVIDHIIPRTKYLPSS